MRSSGGHSSDIRGGGEMHYEPSPVRGVGLVSATSILVVQMALKQLTDMF
jgi:hypothetical protein